MRVLEGNGGGGPDQQAVAPVHFLRGDVNRRVACFLPPSFTRNQLMPPLYASHRRGWTRQTCLVSVLELMEVTLQSCCCTNYRERPIDQEVCPADCPPECPPDKRRREMWIGHRHGHCDLARKLDPPSRLRSPSAASALSCCLDRRTENM